MTPVKDAIARDAKRMVTHGTDSITCRRVNFTYLGHNSVVCTCPAETCAVDYLAQERRRLADDDGPEVFLT